MNAVKEISFESYRGNAAENYHKYFVPSIGAPSADDLLTNAVLAPGERVLDVACGTGLIAGLAAEHVGGEGVVTGVDINPDMLAVARSSPSDIHWLEAGAEELPLPDSGFDVVLCQLGLQFFRDRAAALREMHRVLVAGGRVVVSVPGPEPELFAAIGELPDRYLGPEAAGFLRLVFSLHDQAELGALLRNADFEDVETSARIQRLRLPPPREFLWQYLSSTPLAAAAERLDGQRRAELERGVVEAWEPFTENGDLILEVGLTVAKGVVRGATR